MKWGAADAALKLAILEVEAPELERLLQKGGSEEVEEPAAEAMAAAAGALAVPPPADVDVARRVVARWRAFVAQRKACPVLDLFEQKVLKRLVTPNCPHYARAGGAAVAGGGAGLGAPARAHGSTGAAPARGVLHVDRAAGVGQGEWVPVGRARLVQAQAGAYTRLLFSLSCF
jgi:hypothetical protein